MVPLKQLEFRHEFVVEKLHKKMQNMAEHFMFPGHSFDEILPFQLTSEICFRWLLYIQGGAPVR